MNPGIDERANALIPLRRPGVSLMLDIDGFIADCPSEPNIKLNTDRTVAVATDVFWNEDMGACPRGCKVQLLGEGGVAVYGRYDGKEIFFKKWAPVPRNRPRL